SCSLPFRDLHSFPTRRSSDLSDNYRLSFAQRLGYALTRGWETALVANSHAGLAFASSLHRVPADRGHVVWNGIDIVAAELEAAADRKSTRLNSSHEWISYAVF